MPTAIVVDDVNDWPVEIPEVEIVPAWSYLTDARYSDRRGIKVFNLSRSYRYQTIGYYVSLLAEARGHRPLPSVTTIQDLRSPTITRLISGEIDELIQHDLAPIQSDRFTLSIYFGRNIAKRYSRLSLQLFNLFQAPLLRAQFARDKQKWQLRTVAAIAASDVPDSHWAFLTETARGYFTGRRTSVRRQTTRFDLAILRNPEEVHPPSNEKALGYFVRAAQRAGIAAELIDRDDYARVAEFDALFIRETTVVNHYTYRFSRRAANEGLIVIDDPSSIVRCSNKVYLAELLTRHKLPIPLTRIAHRENADAVLREIGLPCVLKKPDSAFSLGVVKVECEQELSEQLERLWAESDLVVAQQFIPTTFDWRIGILDRKPLYACKYYMARRHWQIVKRNDSGEPSYGNSKAMPVELAPRRAVQLALKAANLIGDGLYGVNVKQSGKSFYIIEVNDNPNIDAGVEDAVLKGELYDRIIQVFLSRLERHRSGVGP